MQTYQLKKPLTSCKVSKDLIQRIESYIIDQAKTTFELPQDAIQDEYRITIYEKYGTQTLKTIADMHASRFADTTNSIELSFQYFRPYISIAVTFAVDRYRANVRIESSGSNALEQAIGFYEGIINIVDSSKTYAWIFHPESDILKGAFVVILPLSLSIVLNSIFKSDLPSTLSRICAMVSLIGGFVVISSWLKPYIAFDSTLADLKDRMWRWAIGSSAAFLIFGNLLPVVRKAIWGF